MLFRITTLVCIIACLSFAGRAQVSVPIAGGARGLAMGQTGLCFTDFHATWTNPAGLGLLEKRAAGLFAEQRFSIQELRQISAAAALPLPNSGIGLVLGYHGLAAFNEQRIGVVYGRQLSQNFRLGIQVFALSTRVADYGNSTTASAELGMQLDLSRDLMVGFRAANPFRMKVAEDEYLPTLLAFGLQYQPGESVSILAEAEKDINYDVRLRLGLEYQLLEALLLRVGYTTQASQVSAGVGYNFGQKLRIDFAAQFHQYLGFSPALGVNAVF